MAENMSIDRLDPTKDESGDESIPSSPGEAATASGTPLEPQQPKRKGGRKPIYATSEERKQRNRQAQAAFRERRTEYIKQLEEAIRTHEQNLASLQAAHRSAADECLMLRYKNSLLERILLEKGVDVKAELHAKTGSPTLGPAHLPQNMVPAPPLQRSILNRHHARRTVSGIAPKLEPGLGVAPLLPSLQAHVSITSPTTCATPSSHSASSSGTAAYSSQHGTSPRSSVHVVTPMPQPMAAALHINTMTGMHAQHSAQMAGISHAMSHARTTDGAQPSPLYPPASFQNHFKQLDQEYDTADLIDAHAEPPDSPIAPAMYPAAAYASAPDPHAMALSSPTTTGPPSHRHMPGQAAVEGGAHSQLQAAYPSMTQMLDPSFDLDPFGLSASMAFPSQFSFDTSNMR